MAHLLPHCCRTCDIVVRSSAVSEALPSNLLSTSEAADLLRMSVRKVQRWARDGKIPYVRQLPGSTGAYLFDRAALTSHNYGG